MPSFDVVSEIDHHELANAIDQANRIVTTRFDFKGIDAKFTLAKTEVTIKAEAEMHITQMKDILLQALSKRGLDVRCVEFGDVDAKLKNCTCVAKVKEGLESDLSKKLVKMIKDQKLKVQAAIQGEQLRITGKKRDDLQEVIAFLRAADIEQPLQFNNFRD